MRLAAATVAFAGCLWAQTPPLMQVEGMCTPETVQALGLDCPADEPCPLFLDLADVAEVANRLVVSGNIHTGSETVDSVLLVSDDGGRTWSEGHARIRSAVLDRIQFIDFEAGWIAGH